MMIELYRKNKRPLSNNAKKFLQAFFADMSEKFVYPAIDDERTCSILMTRYGITFCKQDTDQGYDTEITLTIKNPTCNNFLKLLTEAGLDQYCTDGPVVKICDTIVS